MFGNQTTEPFGKDGNWSEGKKGKGMETATEEREIKGSPRNAECLIPGKHEPDSVTICKCKWK